MMNESEKDLERILFDGLNEHGFIFQEKCAEVLRESAGQTKWRVADTEYPVDSDVKSTRIDIVLKDTTLYPPDNHQIYAIIECKRIGLNRGYWLFGKPLSPSNNQARILRLQAGYSPKGNYSASWSQPKCTFDINSCLIENWWLQITQKGSKQKCEYSSSPQPIEDSFLQACVGVSGMAREIYENIKKDPKDCSVLLIPVIIITAPLYYAGYDLNDVDLASGYINKNRVFFGQLGGKPEEFDWLQVNYPISGSMFPEDFVEDSKTSLLSELRENYQRSIFIVNSKHIVEFFSKLHLG